MRRLIGTVYVDGKAWGPGDRPPAEVAAKITNPAAWAEPTPKRKKAASEDRRE